MLVRCSGAREKACTGLGGVIGGGPVAWGEDRSHLLLKFPPERLSDHLDLPRAGKMRDRRASHIE